MILDVIAWSCLATGLVGQLFRLPAYKAAGIQSVASAFWGAEAIWSGHTWNASVYAALFSWLVWTWWMGGGGDDTKRRLRQWGRAFKGVRRTAPAGAA